MVLRRYTQNDVIFPTALSSPCLSLPLSLIIIFLFFSLPSAVSLDWIAPWPRAPVAMWCCILSPPTPLPLIPIPVWSVWKWSDWCPATLYHSAAVPLQLVASVMPYSQINQSDPRCMHTDHCLRKHIYKLQTSLCLKRHGLDNACDYSHRNKVITVA